MLLKTINCKKGESNVTFKKWSNLRTGDFG